MAIQDSDDASSPGGIQVIARAAGLMRLLQGQPGGLTLSELSEELALPKTTIHRLLQALMAEEFVAPSGRRGRYRIGPGITRLAQGASRELTTLLHPILEALSHRLGETADLGRYERNSVLFIDQVVAPNMLSAVSGVGRSFPLHCTSVGKAALSQLPDDVTRAMPEKLPAFTPHTLADRAELESEVSQARERGFAWDHEEHTVGITAVGTAFRTPAGAILTIGVPMPTSRAATHGEELTQALLATRAEMLNLLESRRALSDDVD